MVPGSFKDTEFISIIAVCFHCQQLRVPSTNPICLSKQCHLCDIPSAASPPFFLLQELQSFGVFLAALHLSDEFEQDPTGVALIAGNCCGM